MERSVFSLRLMSLRKARNLTQGQMADKLQMNRSTYTCYEIGTSMPSIATLCTIADIFDVSLDYLVGRSNCPERDDINDTVDRAEEMQLTERYRMLSERHRRLVQELIKEF